LDAQDIEIGQWSIAETTSDGSSDLTSQTYGGVVGFVLASIGAVFSVFEPWVDPIAFA
jgi:hypothetical protein